MTFQADRKMCVNICENSVWIAESDDDDLIVVKTEYNTVDPITKKEIVDPVR
jgi:hypothetical protein